MKIIARFVFALAVVTAAARLTPTAARPKTTVVADYPYPKCLPCPPVQVALN